MARQYARIHLRIWADSRFLGLSAEAQSLYFKLLTHPTMNLCGVADWRPKRLAALSKGQTIAEVLEAAKELESGFYIVVDEDTEEVLVRSFIRNDGTLRNSKVAVAVSKDYMAVTSTKLRACIVYELRRLSECSEEWAGLDKVSDLLSEPCIDPHELGADTLSDTLSDTQSDRVSDTLSQNRPYPSTLIPQPTTYNLQPSTVAQPERDKIEQGDVDESYPIEFEQFWGIYPRHEGKQSAYQAWRKARRKTNHVFMLAKAQQYANDPNRVGQYTLAPTNWLKGEHWDDDPLPNRNTTPDRSQANQDANAALIAHYAALEAAENNSQQGVLSC
ncbi:hypothetical protein PMS51_09140 [Bifidobacterium longum]|nr:hypothetical protein [Bifidobacterium longum]MDB6819811.1 hypothetical protein [Bifidobacterium longum]